MTISILILLLCLCVAMSWTFTLISSEKTVRLMPFLCVTEILLSAALLILSFFYQKMIVSVLLTAVFLCYLVYLVFHKEAEFQPDKKLLVFSWQKFGKFTCELKEIYASPEAFPRKKDIHAYRTPDNFIMLRCPESEKEYFAYQFTNYHYMLDGKKHNCLVISTADVKKLRLSAYHRKRFFPYAEHLLFAGLMTFLAVPMLFISVMRQSSGNLEDFIKYRTETGITAVSESSAETYQYDNSLMLILGKSGNEITSAKLLSLNTRESELDIITLNSRLMTGSKNYAMLKEILNTEDFSRIKTEMQNLFGIVLNQIAVMENDRLLASVPAEKTVFLTVLPEQLAVLESGVSFRENGRYSFQEAKMLLDGLEQYLVSEKYDYKILSENDLAVMQNEFLLALFGSAVQQTAAEADGKLVRTTMTAAEIRRLYDTVSIAESRYQKCFQQKEHSLVLPSVDDCIKLDSGTLYASDAILRYRMIQALYY